MMVLMRVVRMMLVGQMMVMAIAMIMVMLMLLRDI